MPDMVTLAMANAYCDSKGGYTEQKVVFSETVTTKVGDKYASYNQYEPCKLIAGKRYFVKFDGVTYECVCNQLVGYPFYYIGDMALNDGEKTDGAPPFLIADTSEFTESLSRFGIITSNDSAGEHTVEISEKIIVPFKSEYLGGGLPVIEMDEPVTESRPMTESERAKFEAVVENGLPIIVKFDVGGMSMSLLCQRAEMDGMVAFMAIFNDGSGFMVYVFGVQNGMWVVDAQTI